MFKSILFFLLLLIVVACTPGAPIETPAPVAPDLDPPGGTATHDVGIVIADRYGIDVNDNGVVDMPNTAEYVQAPLQVTLNANSLAMSYPSHWPYDSLENGGFSSLQGPWRWTLTPGDDTGVPQELSLLPTPPMTVQGLSAINDGQRLVGYSDQPKLTIDLFEGQWLVELARLDAAGNAVYWKTADLKIEDFLVVQLGDGYASGEGAPDRNTLEGYWGDDGAGNNGEHSTTHRSSNTWGSRVASRLEAANPAASVTFINLAVSGSLIEDLRAQLDQLSSLVGPREVDAILISTGAGDAGFENAIAAYLIHRPMSNLPDFGPGLPEIEQAIQTGDWSDNKFSELSSVLLDLSDIHVQDWITRSGLSGLNALYEDAALALVENNINPANVYIMQYPDPFVAIPEMPDRVCDGVDFSFLSSILDRQLDIGYFEQIHLREHLINPLNQQIASSADEAGWNLVEAEKVMYGHAICQEESMSVSYEESLKLQGDYKGTLHPNKLGYEAIAELALNALSTRTP
jgi:lysophospholipase L1-like esterase